LAICTAKSILPSFRVSATIAGMRCDPFSRRAPPGKSTTAGSAAALLRGATYSVLIMWEI
jgi:hypothetical protein